MRVINHVLVLVCVGVVDALGVAGITMLMQKPGDGPALIGLGLAAVLGVATVIVLHVNVKKFLAGD